MLKSLAFSIFSVLWATDAFADTEGAPYYYITTAHDLRHQAAAFTMRPPELDPKTWRIVREGGGIAYRMAPDGTLKELYRIEGWYGDANISPDGRNLIRLPIWNRGNRPQPAHHAVAFYLDGKLLKEYSPADLVKDHSKVTVTVSHYGWQSVAPQSNGRPEKPYSDYDKTFRIYTIDGWKYVFDVMTGDIKSVSPITP